MVEKPPYRVPSMAEVRATPRNGLVVASLFAGGGGSSLGYRMAGYRIAWANEFVDEARATYEANADPATVIDGRDIREIKGREILGSTGVRELDVLDGSPPCASFSMAGRREKLWNREKQYSDRKQRTDDLFAEYARIVGEIRPRVFVAENVAGLVVGAAKGHFIRALEQLQGFGYRVRCQMLDAQWLGVPQRRRRVFFVGVRDDLGLDPAFPKPFPYYYSFDEAVAGVVNNPEELAEISLEDYAVGAEYRKTPTGGSSERYFSLVRPDPRLPCPTIMATMNAGCACTVHPREPRNLSVPELRRLCSFPDDFEVTGIYRRRAERFGRAVPPLMMRAIAETIAREVLLR